MFPVIKVLGKAVSADLFFAAIGILSMLLIWLLLGKKYNFSLKNMGFTLLFVSIGAVIGSSIFYFVLNFSSIDTVFEVFKAMDFKAKLGFVAGMLSEEAFFGGFFGAILFLRMYTNNFSKENRMTAMDIFGVSAAFYHVCGKIGCFCIGCCYGIPFKYGLKGAGGIKRIPVALLEVYLFLFLFLLLLKFFNTKKFIGRINFIYMFFASAISFSLEYLRGDKKESVALGLSLNQLVNAVIFAVAFIFFAVTVKSTFKYIFRSEGGMLPTNKNFYKAVFLWIITFGFYGVVIMSSVSKNINRAARPYDGKKTMHYCLLYYFIGIITLGTAYWVWYYKLTKRVSNELDRRNIDYIFTKGDFWLWRILGNIVIIGPFVYLHKLFKAINLINEDNNKRLQRLKEC